MAEPIRIPDPQAAQAVTSEARIEALKAAAGEALDHDPARAMGIYEQAYALACDPDTPSLVGQAESLLGLSKGGAMLGQNERALVHAVEALALYREAAVLPGQLAALRQLGKLYRLLGDFAAALDYQLQGLTLARQLDNRAAQSASALEIGVVFSEMGRYAEAFRSYDQALALCRDHDDLHVEGCILNSYCVDSTNVGAYAEALEYGRRGAQIFELTGDVYGQGAALGSIGEIYVATGQYKEAIETLQQSLELLKRRSGAPNTYEAIAVSYQIGLAYLKSDQLDQAQAQLEATLAHARAARITIFESQCHEQLALLCELRGDLRQALAHYRQFHTLREQAFNEASDQKLKNLEVLHRTQQALDEAERQKQLREDDRRYFEQLAQLQREFFNTATHDLKNPLTALDIGVHMLGLMLPTSDPEVRDVLATIQRGVARMHQLIADFLDLARLETGRALYVRPVAAAPLLEAIVGDHQLVAEQKQLRMSLQSDLADVIVECDPDLLRRALDNVIGNAVKYTPARGRISIVATHTAAAVTIKVVDTGLGIPANDLPHLFERFYRVQEASHMAYEGTGLGLTIVKSIIEQHGGTVWVESELGSGSVFCVQLPLSQAHEATAAHG